MNKEELVHFLEDRQACDTAMAWLEFQDSPEEAWQNCERPDWLLWLIYDLHSAEKLLLCLCECADLVLRPAEEPMLCEYIQAVRRACTGTGSSQEAMELVPKTEGFTGDPKNNLTMYRRNVVRFMGNVMMGLSDYACEVTGSLKGLGVLRGSKGVEQDLWKKFSLIVKHHFPMPTDEELQQL